MKYIKLSTQEEKRRIIDIEIDHFKIQGFPDLNYFRVNFNREIKISKENNPPNLYYTHRKCF